MAARLFREPVEQELRALDPDVFDYAVECPEPVSRFLWVKVL
jgi:hypothetical protein